MYSKGPPFAWRPHAENLENVKGPPFTRRPQAENLGIFGVEGTENFIFERFSTHKIFLFYFWSTENFIFDLVFQKIETSEKKIRKSWKIENFVTS